VSFLDKELGVRGEALGRALTTCPKLLSLSLEENLLPKAFFLKSSLGLSRDDCGKLVRVYLFFILMSDCQCIAGEAVLTPVLSQEAILFTPKASPVVLLFYISTAATSVTCALKSGAALASDFDAQLGREAGAPRRVLARRPVGRARHDPSRSQAGPAALSSPAVL